VFFGINLNQLLVFPFKDAQSRKYFLIGCGIALASFIIPIIPYLILLGYAALIAKQVLNGQEPSMPAWENWEGMLKAGARMFGVRMIYSLPILILAVPLFVGMMAMPIIMDNVNRAQVDSVIIIFSLGFMVMMCVLIPISLPLSVIIPAAEIHTVDQESFAAGFRFSEWWKILRANLGGFIAAFVIFYFLTMALTLVMQLAMATLILICLMPIFMPFITVYSSLVMYTAFAQAYKTGKDKLNSLEKIATAS
jgi:hypothetical protein